MFRTTAVTEPPHDVDTSEPPIPLSVLSLDLPEPPAGWIAYLNNIGVEVVVDDVGRSAISRVDAKQLFDEHREAEALKAEKRAAAEKRAIELASQSYRPRRASVVEDLLDNSGITFHPIQHGGDEP